MNNPRTSNRAAGRHTEPLVMGGQGRSGEQLAEEASAFLLGALALGAGLAVGKITQVATWLLAAALMAP